MNLFTSHSKDGRRANRRPSGWLGLLVLGVIVGATISCLMPKSRPVVPPTETSPQGADHRDMAFPDRRDFAFASLAASMASIQHESDPRAQEELLTTLVSSRALTEIPAALQHLAGDTNRLALELAARWMRRLAEADPQAAAAFALQLPEGAFRSALMVQAVLAWTESDWNTAAEWARGLSAASDREQMLKVVAEETIRLEPVESLRLATELSPGVERDELIVRASMEWAGQDARAAEQWARQIDDSALRSQVLATIAIAWAEQDAHAAATLAVRDLPPGRIQDDAVVSILNRWVQSDADAATAWLTQFPAGPLKQAALDGVMASWSAHDPARAREWLARTTAGSRL